MHYDTMRELLATTEAKVLLAVDEYNELFQPSQWHYGDNKASRGTLERGGGRRVAAGSHGQCSIARARALIIGLPLRGSTGGIVCQSRVRVWGSEKTRG